jgi:predicted permease
LLLSLAAGGLGLLLALALLRTFAAMAPASIPSVAEASIDARVVSVAFLLVLTTALAVGLWPALSILRGGGAQGLRSVRTSSAGTRPHVRFALVTAQIALTLALLGGSALLLRSLWNVVNVPLGFEASGVVTVSARLTAARYPSAESRAAFFDELLVRARGASSTATAALSDAPAPRGMLMATSNINVEGRRPDPEIHHPAIRIRQVTPQYFETFRIPVRRGRLFGEDDRQEGSLGAILSASAERLLFGSQNGVGRRIRLSGAPDEPWRVVVGVVADIRNGAGIADDPQAEVYLTLVDSSQAAHLALRTTASAKDARGFLRQLVADLDPTLPVTIETVEQQVASATERQRFVASLLSAFAILALLLAGAGLYSVGSYLVAQRTSEIGIRMALGASRGHVARQVVAEAGGWSAAGGVFGCAFGWTTTHALQSELYAVETLDPWSWMAALLALMLVLACAVAKPAFSAARVDPIVALKTE